MLVRYFRYADGVLPNCAALGGILLGYLLGVVLLCQASILLNAAGVALTTLVLIWSAYFIHEFAHQTIFKTAQANDRWGTLMCWINGACYAPFDKLRRKHMRHHIDRADVVTFDVKAFLTAAPGWVRRSVLALEWAYVPAVEILMHGFVITMPFKAGQPSYARYRVLLILLLRITAFGLLGWISPRALVLYALSYLLFITVLRFADCFQHTYDSFAILGDTPVPQDKVRDKVYEQTHTFSDIVGLDNRVLNLLWLNFGYHNAHHDRPTLPWYRLPQQHRALYDAHYAQVITVRELLSSFHRHRVNRVLAPDSGTVTAAGTQRRADGFVGAVGVSFLTAV